MTTTIKLHDYYWYDLTSMITIRPCSDFHRNVQRSGADSFQADRRLYHSSLGIRVEKEKEEKEDVLLRFEKVRDAAVSAFERGANNINGLKDLCSENGSNHGHNMALTGLLVPSLLDSGYHQYEAPAAVG